METTTQTPAVQGKFGWYPCDWETYRKLKRLNFLCFEHRKISKAHARWENKLPKNRIQHKWVRNQAGQKIHSIPGEPIPEPRKGCDVLDGRIREGAYRQIPITNFIYSDYRKARFPKNAIDAVEKLFLAPERIDQLLEAAEAWYASK